MATKNAPIRDIKIPENRVGGKPIKLKRLELTNDTASRIKEFDMDYSMTTSP
jgi:hypothetical protein